VAGHPDTDQDTIIVSHFTERVEREARIAQQRHQAEGLLELERLAKLGKVRTAHGLGLAIEKDAGIVAVEQVDDRMCPVAGLDGDDAAVLFGELDGEFVGEGDRGGADLESALETDLLDMARWINSRGDSWARARLGKASSRSKKAARMTTSGLRARREKAGVSIRRTRRQGRFGSGRPARQLPGK
jgi:hypothetical protein